MGPDRALGHLGGHVHYFPHLCFSPSLLPFSKFPLFHPTLLISFLPLLILYFCFFSNCSLLITSSLAETEEAAESLSGQPRHAGSCKGWQFPGCREKCPTQRLPPPSATPCFHRSKPYSLENPLPFLLGHKKYRGLWSLFLS